MRESNPPRLIDSQASAPAELQTISARDEMVDTVGFEPTPSGCKPDMLPLHHNAHVTLVTFVTWWGIRDSNPDLVRPKHRCYHYTNSP